MKKSVQFIAHRGLSGKETENTAASFVAAGNRSYYGIETDIHRTLDGKFAVFHDDNLKRVAGVDIEIEKVNYSDIKDIPLNFKENRSDLRIPLLEDYISICKKYGKKAVLELKNPFDECDIKAVLKIIGNMNFSANMIFISFAKENLISLRKFSPNADIQLLTHKFGENVFELMLKYGFDLDIKHTEATKELIKKIHKAGRKINCWTCDDIKRAQELSSWGVDFITTNILE